MGKRILIIDDDEQDRKGMVQALRREGYTEIAEAATAESGVDLARVYRPEVVVVDVVLHHHDGFDVCKAIKAINDLFAQVIVITGHLEAIEVAKARVSGADEIIEKKAGFEDVHKTIQRLTK